MKNPLLSLILLTLPAELLAEGAAHHGPSLTIMWINFAIFAAGIFYLTRKPFTSIWAKRVQDLEESILKSERELARAEEKLSQVIARTKEAEKEILVMKASISEESKHEVAIIQNQASEQKVRIIKQAELAVASEIKANEKRVRAEFAEQICLIAKDKLQKEFSPDQDRLYRQGSLGGLKSLIKFQ